MRSWIAALLVGVLVALSAQAEGPRVLAELPRVELPQIDLGVLATSLTELEPEPIPAPEPESEPRWTPQPHDPGLLPRWITHESIPRDTIESVAIRYGVPAYKLRRWNGMSEHGQLDRHEPRSLRVKAQRIPPPRERILHEVVEGDTWASIGRRYGAVANWVRAWSYDDTGGRPDPGELATVWIEPEIYASILDDHPSSERAALVAPGAYSIGTPQDGRLVAAARLPAGEGYEILYPNAVWGTTYALRHLVEILDEFHALGVYSGTLIVGVISRMRGGEMGHHISHQSGRDVDIRLPVRRGVPRHKRAVGKRVSWNATLDLVLVFARSGAVDLILLDYKAQAQLYRKAKKRKIEPERLEQLFQYPRGRRASSGLIRHSPGHEGHIHVRFICGPLERACGD